jgi:hypothetical protein
MFRSIMVFNVIGAVYNKSKHRKLKYLFLFVSWR